MTQGEGVVVVTATGVNLFEWISGNINVAAAVVGLAVLIVTLYNVTIRGRTERAKAILDSEEAKQRIEINKLTIAELKARANGKSS